MEAVTVATQAREGLRATFVSGRTRPAAWRAAQLRGLLRMAAEREAEICAALRADLAKPRTESYVHEISLVTSSCKFALKNLEKWMKPKEDSTTLKSGLYNSMTSFYDSMTSIYDLDDRFL